MKRLEVFRDLLVRTSVDELEVCSHPRVIFRVDEITWINVIVRYLVSPREAGSVKTRLIPKLLCSRPEPTVSHIHGGRSCSQDHLPRKGL
jgi:hypothetical protein